MVHQVICRRGFSPDSPAPIAGKPAPREIVQGIEFTPKGADVIDG